jgi:hypothetical protein
VLPLSEAEAFDGEDVVPGFPLSAR